MRRSRPLLASYFAYFDPCPTNTSTESSESTRSRVDSEDSVEVLKPMAAVCQGAGGCSPERSSVRPLSLARGQADGGQQSRKALLDDVVAPGDAPVLALSFGVHEPRLA